jgi:hypothetical protein
VKAHVTYGVEYCGLNLKQCNMKFQTVQGLWIQEEFGLAYTG